MTRKRYYIVLLLTMLITLTAGATAYDATSVKMCTSAGDISMVRIGMTADSCGIWVCRNTGEDKTNVRWQIDDQYNIACVTDKYDTNTLYQLTSYTDLNSDLAIAGDSTVYIYLKVKDQEHAQCFLWDGNTIPDFASDFQLTGYIDADVADGYEGDNCYIHMFRYKVSGMSEEAFDHFSIELSYDGGTTWTTVNGYATIMNATLPIMLPLDKDTVRYHITAYVKDSYRAIYNDSTWTYETPDYKITQIRYRASKVGIATGFITQTTQYCTELGVTKDGYQIWGTKGLGVNATTSNYATWTVDDGNALSAAVAVFQSYTIYPSLNTSFTGLDLRTVHSGSQWNHFVKVYSKKKVDCFRSNTNSENNKKFRPYSFYLYAEFTLDGKEIFVNHDTHTLQREMSYGVKYIYGEVLDSLALYASCDKGKTWKQISALTTGFDKSVRAFNKSDLVNLPGNGTTIRYRIVAYAKDAYKVLSDDGIWVYETTDSTLTFSEASSASTITVNTINPANFSNTEGTPRGTYRADITYHMLGNLADQVDSIQIQCSNDHGKTWSFVDAINKVDEEETVRIPAGYASYMLRAVPFLKGDLANVPLLSQPVTSTEQTITYNPEVTSLTAEKTATVERYGKTLHTYTVRYALNTDLYRTRGEASISYSYDDGQHWYQLQPFEPNPSGEQTVKVDGSQRQCRFRIEVGSTAYDNKTFYTRETQNITFE